MRKNRPYTDARQAVQEAPREKRLSLSLSSFVRSLLRSFVQFVQAKTQHRNTKPIMSVIEEGYLHTDPPFERLMLPPSVQNKATKLTETLTKRTKVSPGVSEK